MSFWQQFKYNLYKSTTYTRHKVTQAMKMFKSAGSSKLDSIVRFRVTDEIKSLLKSYAKSLKLCEADAGRFLLEDALKVQYSSEKIALERFEELQIDHKAMEVKLQHLSEKMDLTHEMASAVLAFLASRELGVKQGTKDEVMKHTKMHIGIAVALGSKVRDRHQRGLLGRA